MMKTVVLIIELALTIAMFVMVFNMTTFTMMSYKQSTDSLTQTINSLEQNMPVGDVPTGYAPAATNSILSNLINFKL
jgi:hypothetical protein